MLPHGLTHFVSGGAQVACGRGDVLVAEQGLDCADVGALLKGAGREGLATCESTSDQAARHARSTSVSGRDGALAYADGSDVRGSARKDVVFEAGRVYTTGVPGPRRKSCVE
jgi:hypothetical protein